MKALFVGLGSIGQRHLNNFMDIAGDMAEILVYRETDRNVLIKNGIGTPCLSLQHHYGFIQVGSLDDGLNEMPDIVFITNPSSRHLDTALKSARSGCNLFIEKPLSHTLHGLDELLMTVNSGGLIATVGYQTRFHPCYKLVFQILSENKYGDLKSASFEWGTFLPSHHPYEDYRQGYAARKSMGGGVVLGLSHEIDLMCSIWGQPEKLFAIGGKLGSLSMDAEDTVSVLMGFKRNKRIIPVTLFLSYAQRRETREFRIQFEDALMQCDLLNNKVSIIDNDNKILEEKHFVNFTRNDLFRDEMREILTCVKNKTKPSVSLQDGVEAMKLAMRIKEELGGDYIEEI